MMTENTGNITQPVKTAGLANTKSKQLKKHLNTK